MAMRTCIARGEHHIPGELPFHVHIDLLDNTELEVCGLVKQCSGKSRKSRWTAENRKSAGHTDPGRGLTPPRRRGAERGRKGAPGGTKTVGLSEEGWILPQALGTLAPGGIVEDAVACADDGLVAAKHLPCQANSWLKCRPIHLDARRRVHSTLIGDQQLIRKRIVVCHAPVLFRDGR